jgi:hypothetical protein
MAAARSISPGDERVARRPGGTAFAGALRAAALGGAGTALPLPFGLTADDVLLARFAMPQHQSTVTDFACLPSADKLTALNRLTG